MAKRDLFSELIAGFDALKLAREGKITLRTTEIDIPQPIEMRPKQIARIRKEHNYSQAVFARLLSTKVSTLRNWEQGRSEPNAQAKVLLKLVDTDPEVLAALAKFTTGTVNVNAKAKHRTKAKRNQATKKAVRARAEKKKPAARGSAAA